MAVLKTNKYAVTTAAVIEDPIPTSNYIYFQHDAHNKTTFAPQFDTWIQHSASGTGITNFGYAAGTNYYMGGTLVLTGNTTHVNHTSTTINDYQCNLDPSPFISMDTTRPFSWSKYYTDGTNTSVWLSYTQMYPGSIGFATNFEYKLNPGTDMTKTLPTLAGVTQTNLGGSQASNGNSATFPVYINPNTKNLVFCPWTNSNGAGYYIPYRGNGAHAGALGTANLSASNYTGVAVAAQTIQFLGVGTDGYATFFGNNYDSDYQQTIWKYNDSATTITTLATITAIPGSSGGGTLSLGGNRAATFGSYFPKLASNTFQDPLLGSGTQGFYVPFFDTVGNYNPFYFQWTIATGVITRNINVAVSWGARTQATTWGVDTISASSVTVNYGLQRLVVNETFTFSGTRYLMLMQLHGNGVAYDLYPLMRTFVVFSMNPTNPLALTYHSFVTIPVTPKNIIWLNTAKTLLGVITTNFFYTYSFTSGTGWTLTGSLPYQMWAVGLDSTGRIFGVDRGLTQQGQIHIITLSVPVTVSVTPAQTTYNYTGSTISSTLAVSAYDQTGSRISTQVKLVIDGGSMTFGGSNLTTTVTTSTVADLSVAISITDGGYSNIIASVVLS